MESPLKKKRRRYYNERKREFAALNAKYTPIFRSLCGLQGDFLDYNDYQNAAWEYADKRARANLTWYQSIISGNGANMIINIVLLVVSIALCFTPAAPAGAAGIGAVIASTTSAVVSVVIRTITIVAQVVSALASFASSIISQHYSFKTEGLAGLAQGKSGASEAYKRREQAEQQRNTLTALMVFGGYSIYAGGEVYNQHSAGTQTYNALTPLDTTKGIRGDIQQESELSKMIHTRTGADMAGGENYTANVLNLPFPLQKFGFGSTQIQDGLVNRYLSIVKTLNNAFVELNNLSINADGKAQTLYNNKLSKLTSQTEHALYSDDFLNKMKNYSRGMMADFTYKNRDFFNPKDKNVYGFDGALSLDNIKGILESDDFTNEEKSRNYVDFLCSLFDALQTMSETPSCYGTFGWINGYFYPASDWDNVINRKSSKKKYSGSARAREAAEKEIVYKNLTHDVTQEGILKAGAWTIEYFTTDQKYRGDELLELFKKEILSNLLIKNGYWGLFYNANVARGVLKSDYNKVWRVLGWTYDGYAWWEYKETLYNYECFINLGKENYEVLQEFYELGQSPIIQNHLFGIEVEKIYSEIDESEDLFND